GLLANHLRSARAQVVHPQVIGGGAVLGRPADGWLGVRRGARRRKERRRGIRSDDDVDGGRGRGQGRQSATTRISYRELEAIRTRVRGDRREGHVSRAAGEGGAE